MDEPLFRERTITTMKGLLKSIGTSVKIGSGHTSTTTMEQTTFDELFLEHWEQVCRLLLRLVGDPQEAEDLALETFLRYTRRLPAPGADSNLEGWLFRVATNLGLQSIRSFRRRERYELAAGKSALEEVSRDGPAELLTVEEERRTARLALSRMRPQQAQLLVLRYSGLAYKEIAAELKLSPASIGPLLARAERAFEKRYCALAKEDE